MLRQKYTYEEVNIDITKYLKTNREGLCDPLTYTLETY